jgi:hypothetical protein
MTDWSSARPKAQQTELLQDGQKMSDAAVTANMETASASGHDWRVAAAELLSKFASKEGKYSLAGPGKYGDDEWHAETKKWIGAYWEEVCRLSRLSSIPLLEEGSIDDTSKDRVASLIDEMIEATSIKCSEDARAAMLEPFQQFSLIAKTTWDRFFNPFAGWPTPVSKG